MEEKNKTKDRPSAVDDCADVTSKYKRYKKKYTKSHFTPIKYEKPPHF